MARSIRHSGIVVHYRLEDCLVDAAGVFLDLGAADADSFRVGEQLLGDFCDRYDVGAGRRWDVLTYPFMQEVGASCAHTAISCMTKLGSRRISFT